MAVELYDGTRQLAEEIGRLHRIHAKYFGSSAPFYWTRVHEDPKVSAPSGWYQWTERGLVYLGETIIND